jgi:recombination protein RecA
MDANRDKAIDLAVSQIERQFGKGAIMKLGEGGIVKDVPVVSTGSLGLDIALGIGGVPRGRVIEIYGPEASGKTTLALQIVAEAQKQGGMGAYIDAEHALDLGYAKKLGVKTDRSGAIDVLVIDSVAALVPKAEIEGEMGDAHMGLQARLMSQALRKLTGTISRSQTVVIFINQIRMKIGVMFGNPETTTGGNALKFYASVRMDIRRIGALKDGDNIVGGRTRVKVVKNKMAPPFKEAEFDILYGTGISRDGETIDLGSEMGIVEKSGAWYSFGGERIGQGRESAKQFLKEHPETAEQIMTKVMEKVGLKRAEPESPAGEKREKTKGR